jgi:undecaprenyl-diphosphatase
VYVDLVNARRQLEPVLGKRLAGVVALIGVLRHGRPHELVLDSRRRRLWLYFAGNCRYEPQGMAPAYRPDLADGWLDIRIVEATVLARSRLVAAVLTGTLSRSRVYHAWAARSVDVRAADGRPIWLSTDGEVATAASGFVHTKHPRELLVYRRRAPSHAGYADVHEDAARATPTRTGAWPAHRTTRPVSPANRPSRGCGPAAAP